VPALSVDVQQYRRDEVDRMLEIKVGNSGREPVVIESVQLDVPQFTAIAPTDVRATIQPGDKVDLRTAYGEARCGTTGPRNRSVVVTSRNAGSTPRRVEIDVESPHPLLDRLAATDCARENLAQQVGLRLASSIRRVRRDGAPALQVPLVVERRDASVEIVITQLRGSVLFGAIGSRLPARLSPRRDRMGVAVTLTVVRCDPHVRAEIKRPFDFTAWVSVDAAEPVAVPVPVDPPLQRELRRLCPF
jgi:hypothetical protein